MQSSISFRTGDEKSLVPEFLQLINRNVSCYSVGRLADLDALPEDDILAVQFAHAGAQGDAGAVKILCRRPRGVQVLYGNYAYGDLDERTVMQKLSMLSLNYSPDRLEPPCPFLGSSDDSVSWGYLYMGAGNHFFARKDICEKASTFIDCLLRNGGNRWYVFDAVAWFCGGK